MRSTAAEKAIKRARRAIDKDQRHVSKAERVPRVRKPKGEPLDQPFPARWPTEATGTERAVNAKDAARRSAKDADKAARRAAEETELTDRKAEKEARKTQRQQAMDEFIKAADEAHDAYEAGVPYETRELRRAAKAVRNAALDVAHDAYRLGRKVEEPAEAPATEAAALTFSTGPWAG